MEKLGLYLKTQRLELDYSLKDVSKKTGITNSRLCRIENGKLNYSPIDLKKLASLYKIPIIPLFLAAGYLEESDLTAYQQVFVGASLLDKDEKEHLQWLITRLTQKKGSCE